MCKFQHRRTVFTVFLQLLCAGIGYPPVGHCGYCDKNILIAYVRQHCIVHLLCGLNLNALHPEWYVECGRAGYQGDNSAGLPGGAGDCVAHLAGRQVGDAAHWINRLESRAGGQQNALACQDFWLEGCDDVLQQLGRFQHPAHAVFAAGLGPGVGSEQFDAICCQLRHIAPGGGVLPHFDIHRRRYQQR